MVASGETYVFMKSGNEVRALTPAEPYHGQPCWTVVRTTGKSTGKAIIIPARAFVKSQLKEPRMTQPTPKDRAPGAKPKHMVTEGIAGVWHYHLSDPKTFTRGLCGAQTMITSIEAADFGKPFGEHLPKRPTWCTKCQQLSGHHKLSNDTAAQ